MPSQRMQIQARERARARKALLDEQRAEHDRKMEGATTDYYAHQSRREVALEEVHAAEAGMASAVGALVDLGLANAEIRLLCDLPETELRAMKKRAREGGDEDQDALVPDAGV